MASLFLFAINRSYFLLFTSLMYFSKAIVIEGVSGLGLECPRVDLAQWLLLPLCFQIPLCVYLFDQNQGSFQKEIQFHWG